jgi:hypothetical protein
MKTTAWFSLMIGSVLALGESRLPAAGAPQPTPVRALVGDVTDNRTTGSFSSECKVEVKFTGDAAIDAGSVRQVRVLEAVDEVGRDLKPAKDENDSHSMSMSGRSGGTLKAEVKLRNPSRNATTIKLLKGEVELFSPTEANGAIIRIKDVLKHPAEPILHETLKKNNVVLMYLTKESYEAKKKEIEAQQSAGGNAGENVGAAFGELFKGMFGGMMSSGSKDAIQLYMKDPDKRIMELEFQDGNGKPLKTSGSWSSNEFKQTNLNAPPPADTQLMIKLAVPEAVKVLPFELKDIALP